MHSVLARKENVTFYVRPGSNLREACIENGIDVYPIMGGRGPFSCHGHGFCGQCVVEVDEPEALSEPTKRERRKIGGRIDSSKGRVRLSCQAEVRGELTVETLPDPGHTWKSHTYYSGEVVRTWERPSASE